MRKLLKLIVALPLIVALMQCQPPNGSSGGGESDTSFVQPIEQDTIIQVPVEVDTSTEILEPPVFEVPKPVEEDKPIPVEPVKPPVVLQPKPEHPIVKPPVVVAPTSKTLKDSPVIWGVAFKESHINDKGVISETVKQFRSLTPENGIKVGHVQKKEGVFNFTNAKGLAKIAAANGMRLHGHACFIWPSQEKNLPAFWHEAAKDKKKYIALLKKTVQTTVREFKGVIKAWDVVNEAHENSGELRPCYAKTHLGDNYIEIMAGWIKEVDPEAKVFISDYDFETASKKAAVVIAYAGELKKKGLIDGISSQMHTTLKMKYDVFTERLNRMAKAGLLVHLSEVDIIARPEQEKEKAAKYKEIVKGFRTIPEKLQYGITVWSFQDDWNFMNYQKDPKPYAPAIFSKGYSGGLTLSSILEVK